MNIVNKVKNKLWYELNPFFRERIILPYRRNRFNNPDVTILSSNCLGGCMTLICVSTHQLSIYG